MNYLLSQLASKDLEEIWLYTSKKWSREQADKYYNSLMDEIAGLCKNPFIGQDYSHIRPGYLRLKFQSHYIFYRINNQKEQLEIIRILHQRMDIENWFYP